MAQTNTVEAHTSKQGEQKQDHQAQDQPDTGRLSKIICWTVSNHVFLSVTKANFTLLMLAKTAGSEPG